MTELALVTHKPRAASAYAVGRAKLAGLFTCKTRSYYSGLFQGKICILFPDRQYLKPFNFPGDSYFYTHIIKAGDKKSAPQVNRFPGGDGGENSTAIHLGSEDFVWNSPRLIPLSACFFCVVYILKVRRSV